MFVLQTLAEAAGKLAGRLMVVARGQFLSKDIHLSLSLFLVLSRCENSTGSGKN